MVQLYQYGGRNSNYAFTGFWLLQKNSTNAATPLQIKGKSVPEAVQR